MLLSYVIQAFHWKEKKHSNISYGIKIKNSVMIDNFIFDWQIGPLQMLGGMNP